MITTRGHSQIQQVFNKLEGKQPNSANYRMNWFDIASETVFH